MKLSKKTKIWMGGMAFLALLVLLLVFVQANSIAYTVSTKWDSPTVNDAFAKCEADRTKFRSQGMACEECQLRCPTTAIKQSNGLYSFAYPSTSTAYTGAYTNLECDTIGGRPGALLEVTSYCNDAIRVCQKQDGTGTVTKTEQTTNGVIQTISYKVYTTNCDTGAVMGTSVPVTGYQLVCNSGYTADGRRTSSSKSLLGTCVSATQQNEPGFTPLAGTYQSVKYDDTASPGEEVVLHATFTPQVDGRYYLYARVDTSSRVQALAVSSGFASIDLCGSDQYAAGTFKDLHAGDTALIEFSIPSPKDLGTYNVYVGAKQGCNGADMDVEKGSVRVIGKEQQQEEVINTPVNENADEANEIKDEVSDEYDEIAALEACNAATDLSINGCAVALCVEGEVVLLNEEQIREQCQNAEVEEIITDVVNEKESTASDENRTSFDLATDWSTMQGKIVYSMAAIIVVLIVGIFVFKTKGKR